jgi:hypothetical protein
MSNFDNTKTRYDDLTSEKRSRNPSPPIQTADALKFADELERAINEVLNGRRKPGAIPVEAPCKLIQFAREGVSVQEAWEAAGGNPGIRAKRDQLLLTLQSLNTVPDVAEDPADADRPS